MATTRYRGSIKTLPLLSSVLMIPQLRYILLLSMMVTSETALRTFKKVYQSSFSTKSHSTKRILSRKLFKIALCI